MKGPLAALAAMMLIWAWSARAEAPQVPDQAGLAAKVAAAALDQRDWKPVVNLPPGAMVSVLSEDPIGHGIEALVDFPKAYAVAPHWHRNTERILVVRGRLSFEGGGRKVRLDSGDTLFVPSMLVHSLSTGRFSGCVFYLKTDGPVGFTYLNPEDRAR